MLSWEILFGAGTAALALAIAWGLWQYYHRDRANDALTEAATRAEYKDSANYPADRARLSRLVRR